MNVRESIDKIDAARRATTLILQRLDVGSAKSPRPYPIAVEASAGWVDLCAFHFTATAIVLTGMVPDSHLEVAEIPEPPARPTRRTSDQVAAD